MTPLLLAALVFAGAAVVTVLGSIRLAVLGDVLADRTGWGEAIFGAVFFGWRSRSWAASSPRSCSARCTRPPS